jgi:DNA-directed RNA polymerase subunit RPC12/RpoP
MKSLQDYPNIYPRLKVLDKNKNEITVNTYPYYDMFEEIIIKDEDGKMHFVEQLSPIECQHDCDVLEAPLMDGTVNYLCERCRAIIGKRSEELLINVCPYCKKNINYLEQKFRDGRTGLICKECHTIIRYINKSESVIKKPYTEEEEIQAAKVWMESSPNQESFIKGIYSNPESPNPYSPQESCYMVPEDEPSREYSNPEFNEFGTGAKRSKDVDDRRYDLISPIGLAALARAYYEGSIKYPVYNCESGFQIYDLLNHSIAHIYNYLNGDRNEEHLGHAMWGLCMAIHSEATWPELNEGTLRQENGLPPLNPNNLYWKDIKARNK